jgi:hypothetical protein
MAEGGNSELPSAGTPVSAADATSAFAVVLRA